MTSRVKGQPHASKKTALDALAREEENVRRKMKDLKDKAEQLAKEISWLVQDQLMYLPEEIQNMRVQDYMDKFDGNRSAFANRENNSSIARLNSSSFGKGSHRTAIKNYLQRSAGKRNKAVQMTPLNQGTAQTAASNLTTVKAHKTPGGSSSQVVSMLVNDEEIKLTPNTLKELPAASRVNVAEQLENFEKEMERKLQQIRSGLGLIQ